MVRVVARVRFRAQPEVRLKRCDLAQLAAIELKSPKPDKPAIQVKQNPSWLCMPTAHRGISQAA